MTFSIHRAKYVWAEPDAVLDNAAVALSEGGRILRVGRWQAPREPRAQVTDWGTAAILPGLVNAHTHLDLTALGGRIGRPDSFTGWLSELLSRRRPWNEEDFQSSEQEGARLSLAAGTTLAGDIVSGVEGRNPASVTILRRLLFFETIALAPEQAEGALQRIRNLLDREQGTARGVSPHAPYTVSPQLYRRAAELARSRGLPLATHAAETRAELEFLESGGGEFRGFLSAMGALPAGWAPPGLAPVPYLQSLGVLGPRCLLVHCNYMGRDSIDAIRASRSSVVYCPRSHDFFGHEPHPVRQLLDAGVNVALGTDSLASSTSLSMLDEMRFLRSKRADIEPREIFRAATSGGAAALGFGQSLGRLRPGYRADMTVIGLPERTRAGQLPGSVLDGAGECIGTVVDGRVAWRKAGGHTP